MDDLERILHEYLVKDLLDLKKSRVGFPTLMTVFAGVELLGALLGDGEHGTQRADFKRYWTEYLYPKSVRPRTVAEAKIIYEGVRHGVMHHFFPKGPVGVTGSDPGAHLTCRPDGVLILDTKVLVDDFVRAYTNLVVPILATPSGKPSRASMQKRLNDIRRVGKLKMRDLNKVFTASSATRPHSIPPATPSDGANQGPSGPI